MDGGRREGGGMEERREEGREGGRERGGREGPHIFKSSVPKINLHILHFLNAIICIRLYM